MSDVSNHMSHTSQSHQLITPVDHAHQLGCNRRGSYQLGVIHKHMYQKLSRRKDAESESGDVCVLINHNRRFIVYSSEVYSWTYLQKNVAYSNPGKRRSIRLSIDETTTYMYQPKLKLLVFSLRVSFIQRITCMNDSIAYLWSRYLLNETKLVDNCF